MARVFICLGKNLASSCPLNLYTRLARNVMREQEGWCKNPDLADEGMEVWMALHTLQRVQPFKIFFLFLLLFTDI